MMGIWCLGPRTNVTQAPVRTCWRFEILFWVFSKRYRLSLGSQQSSGAKNRAGGNYFSCRRPRDRLERLKWHCIFMIFTWFLHDVEQTNVFFINKITSKIMYFFSECRLSQKDAKLYACLISWLGACLQVRLRLPSLRTHFKHKTHTRFKQYIFYI